jgi:hypothetical protein
MKCSADMDAEAIAVGFFYTLKYIAKKGEKGIDKSGEKE